MTTDLQVRIEKALGAVRDQASLLAFFRDCLEWPLPERPTSVEAVAYEWPLADLKAEGLSEKLAQSHVYQLAPLAEDQPWGIFLVEFASDTPFQRDRGLSGPLRRLLAGLVESKRKSPHLPSWKREHLLFICTHKFQHFRIAYFRTPPEGRRQPTLAAFGWGPDIPARTACEFNLPALCWPDESGPDPWVAAWTRAFDVERVTDRFFRDYVDLFGNNENAIGKASGYKDAICRLYTQVQMNRLIFLRFVERKGWLKLGPDSNYLANLWANYQADRTPKKNFYRDRLRPLFFEGLALDDPQRKAELIDRIGEVPFINGGLFDHITHGGKDLDAKVTELPDRIFEPLLDATRGLLYRYNFTVAESTPLSIEVAVDPEILGRVFEELIISRHETGSYYTPRPIVSFMCKEALKGYLAKRTGIPAEAIERLVDAHDDSGLTDRLEQVPALLVALEAVRAVDPACGSGAYLLGLLHELIDLYKLLYQAGGEAGESTYRLKMKIISNSLYGVDLDPVATNIAMLRLWLSLAVEAPRALALPNLDFMIETGNAILGPNPEQPESLLLYERVRQLSERKAQYLTAHGAAKTELASEIREGEQALARQIEALYGEGVIEWRVQFAEVMLSEAGGFDIVLANPPYERQELLVEIKPHLKAVYGSLFSGTADLLVYFYYRALELLRPGGMLAIISSNKWLKAGYGKQLREHMLKEAEVWSLTDFRDLPVFRIAIAYPVIVIAQKGGKGMTTLHTEVPSLDAPYPDIKAIQTLHGTRLGADSFKGSTWILAGGAELKRLRKMEQSGIPLGEYVNGQIFYGIKTGFNEAFVINGARRAELIAQDPKSAEIIKPLLRGRDIKRWCAEHNDQYLIFTRRGTQISDYPAIKRHLQRWKAQLTPLTRDQSESNRRLPTGQKTPGRKPGSYLWYEIQDEVAYYDAFERPKIVYPVQCKASEFSFVSTAAYINDKCFCITNEDTWICALLNSSDGWMWLHAKCSPLAGGFREMRRAMVALFPVPRIQEEDQTLLTNLVQKCLDAKGVDCEEWEQEINERVAALYGL